MGGRTLDDSWDPPAGAPSLEVDDEALRDRPMYVRVTGNPRPLLKSAPPQRARLPRRIKLALLGLAALAVLRFGPSLADMDERELSASESAELHPVLRILPGPLRRTWAGLLRAQVREATAAPVRWPPGEGKGVACFVVRPGPRQREQLHALRETGVPTEVSDRVLEQLVSRGAEGPERRVPLCLWLP